MNSQGDVYALIGQLLRNRALSNVQRRMLQTYRDMVRLNPAQLRYVRRMHAEIVGPDDGWRE